MKNGKETRAPLARENKRNSRSSELIFLRNFVALLLVGVFFILSYRSPSHNASTEVDDYCARLQVLIDNINKEKPSMVVLTGDFNARSPLFWDQEAEETLPGRKLSKLMLQI